MPVASVVGFAPSADEVDQCHRNVSGRRPHCGRYPDLSPCSFPGDEMRGPNLPVGVSAGTFLTERQVRVPRVATLRQVSAEFPQQYEVGRVGAHHWYQR